MVILPATPDDNTWPVGIPIASVELDGKVVNVTWQDGRASRYHGIWLRDNCACPDCANHHSHEQLFEVDEFPENLAVEKVEIDVAGALKIVWSPDKHVSRYHPGWLRSYDYSNGESPEFDLQPVIWEDVNWSPQHHDGQAFMSDDSVVLEVLNSLATAGICILTNLGDALGTVAKVGERIGPLYETHWGRIYDVKVVPGAHSTAYTALPLQAHTDLPNFEVPPGLQILHCLKHSVTGGESVLIDGLRMARDIKNDSPEDFELLSSVKWEHVNRAGGSADARFAPPIFVTDEHHEVTEVRLATFSRAPLMCDFDLVEPAFRALRRFLASAKDPKYRLIVPFAPGIAILFNNRRILHTRLPFDPETGERHLQGCYLHKDAWLSRRRAIIRAKTKSQEEYSV